MNIIDKGLTIDWPLKKVQHFRDQEWEKIWKFMVFHFFQTHCTFYTSHKTKTIPSFENSTLHHKITRLGGGAYYKDCQKKFPVKYVTQKLKVIADKEMTIVTW